MFTFEDILSPWADQVTLLIPLLTAILNLMYTGYPTSLPAVSFASFPNAHLNPNFSRKDSLEQRNVWNHLPCRPWLYNGLKPSQFPILLGKDSSAFTYYCADWEPPRFLPLQLRCALSSQYWQSATFLAWAPESSPARMELFLRRLNFFPEPLSMIGGWHFRSAHPQQLDLEGLAPL